MTPGANDLTTLSNVKTYLRLTQTTDDNFIQSLITNASAFIQTFVSRIFASANYTETRDGLGCLSRKIAFSNIPVTAVSSVMIDGVNVPASPDFFSAGYRFNSNFLVLNGYAFTEGFQNIVLSYTAGYSTTPADIAQACIQMVALRYREAERIGQNSKTLNGENVTFTNEAMSPDVAITLGHWQKVMIV